MGNIVYKVAPSRMIDEHIRTLKDIIRHQHIQMQSVGQNVLIYKEKKVQPEFTQLSLFEEDYETACDDDICFPYHISTLNIGDVIEITFLPEHEENDKQFFNSIPFVAVITTYEKSWMDATIIYEALQINVAYNRYEEPIISNSFTFTQEDINYGTVKIRLIIRTDVITSSNSRVGFDEYTDEWE